jgi:AbrB family looped-hinge helix DNA binding protein
MAASTLTSKGQITIPKEIRDQLRLRIGQKLDFRLDSHGGVVLLPRTQDVRQLKGIVKSRRKKPVSVEEMNEAIARGFAEL